MTKPESPREQSRFLNKWFRLIAVAAAVVIAFLLGFIPEYLRASKLSDDLNGVQQERQNLLAHQRSLQLRGQIDQLQCWQDCWVTRSIPSTLARLRPVRIATTAGTTRVLFDGVPAPGIPNRIFLI